MKPEPTFYCASCEWSGYRSETSVLRNIGMTYVDQRNGRSLPSCPRCNCPAATLED